MAIQRATEMEMVPCTLGVLIIVWRPDGTISTFQMTLAEFRRLQGEVG